MIGRHSDCLLITDLLMSMDIPQELTDTFAGTAAEAHVQRLLERDDVAVFTPTQDWDSELTRQLRSASRNAVCSGLLLWNDALDASHTVSQDISSATGSYWHGIMHRREPDYWNAKYWFRRVGTHPLAPKLREAAIAAADGFEDAAVKDLAARFANSATWDAFVFVDLCEQYARDQESPVGQYLRTIQRDEICLLLIYSQTG
jgi:hypothetical protein